MQPLLTTPVKFGGTIVGTTQVTADVLEFSDELRLDGLSSPLAKYARPRKLLRAIRTRPRSQSQMCYSVVATSLRRPKHLIIEKDFGVVLGRKDESDLSWLAVLDKERFHSLRRHF